MDADFTPQDSVALYELLAEQLSDVVIKCDGEGVVRHSSPAAHRWAIDAAPGRRLLELVDPSCQAALQAELERVLAGGISGAVEIAATGNEGASRWFDLRLRALKREDGTVDGVIVLMRSIQDRRLFEEKLFAAAMTDPLTGLTNRRAFMSMLQHLVDADTAGCLALFSLDYFKALNMRFGQSFGDEVLVTFAELLRNMMRGEDIISRIGSETLGVLLPGAQADQAEAICQRVIAALADIRQAAGPDSVSITASVGVSRIGKSLDTTMKRAEMALFLARAKGRNRLEMDSGRRLPQGNG